MDYHLHITRADQLLNADQYPILFDEWRAFVEADAEMHMADYNVVQRPSGPQLTIDGDAMATWKAPASDCYGGNPASFHYDEGKIAVKNPDKHVIRKMKAIAGHFRAHVVGEEGELY